MTIDLKAEFESIDCSQVLTLMKSTYERQHANPLMLESSAHSQRLIIKRQITRSELPPINLSLLPATTYAGSGTIGELGSLYAFTPPPLLGISTGSSSDGSGESLLSSTESNSSRVNFGDNSGDSVFSISSPVISSAKASRALALLINNGEHEKANEMKKYMKGTLMALDTTAFSDLMSVLSREKKHANAILLFQTMVNKFGLEPTKEDWSELIHAKSRNGDVDGALADIDRIQKVGVRVTTSMFTSVLAALVSARRNEKAYEVWVRMHEEGLDFSKEAFTQAIKLCINTKETERAFFYVDEMKAMDITPDADVFAALFRSCADAPHWVHGYHDIIFDAMCLMEGAELEPTAQVYNNIIYAFAKANDPGAAEFYFWEMRQKGIEQSSVTYSNLFLALAGAQRVGASTYGALGRWVRPPEAEKTDYEKAYLKIGSEKAMEMGKINR